MGKIRRGGFLIYIWKGDHVPRHIHVLKDGRLILKWSLDEERVLKGRAPRRLREIIKDLVAEGKL